MNTYFNFFIEPVDFCSLSKIEKKASSMDIDLITSEVDKACSSKLELELPKFESLQPNHQYTSRNYILPVHSKDLFESCIIANPLLFLSPNLIEVFLFVV